MALMGSCCKDGGARKQGKYSLQVCWWKSDGIGLLSNLPFVCLSGMTKNNPAIDALPITSRTTSEIAVQQLLGDLCLWITGEIFGGSKTNMAIFLLFLEHQVLDPVCSQLTDSMQPTKVSADFLANFGTMGGRRETRIGQIFCTHTKILQNCAG